MDENVDSSEGTYTGSFIHPYLNRSATFHPIRFLIHSIDQFGSIHQFVCRASIFVGAVRQGNACRYQYRDLILLCRMIEEINIL